MGGSVSFLGGRAPFPGVTPPFLGRRPSFLGGSQHSYAVRLATRSRKIRHRKERRGRKGHREDCSPPMTRMGTNWGEVPPGEDTDPFIEDR